mmetsp:Transcript_18964/g.45572  ORF Transcript_18964/g.45572 Transcript_18964/m.45572 type:complete len:257 (-) Transcript_18964:1294-2064(-)
MAKTPSAMETVLSTGLTALMMVDTRIRRPLARAMMRRGRSARRILNVRKILSIAKSMLPSSPYVSTMSSTDVETMSRSSLFHPERRYSLNDWAKIFTTHSKMKMPFRMRSMMVRNSRVGLLSPMVGLSMASVTELMRMALRTMLSNTLFSEILIHTRRNGLSMSRHQNAFSWDAVGIVPSSSISFSRASCSSLASATTCLPSVPPRSCEFASPNRFLMRSRNSAKLISPLPSWSYLRNMSVSSFARKTTPSDSNTF